MERLIVYKKPTDPVTEAYRRFCANMLATLGGKKTVEIVAVSDSSNASLITANLAVAMAQAGKRVLLVDCNLHNPCQHTLFNLQNNGITDCLAAEGDITYFVQVTPQQNLFILTAGAATTQNPVEALMGISMQKVFFEAKADYDVILLDVPSIGAVSDAISLGAITEGVLLVLTNKKDKVEQVQKVKEMFIQAGVTILGCVLDKV